MLEKQQEELKQQAEELFEQNKFPEEAAAAKISYYLNFLGLVFFVPLLFSFMLAHRGSKTVAEQWLSSHYKFQKNTISFGFILVSVALLISYLVTDVIANSTVIIMSTTISVWLIWTFIRTMYGITMLQSARPVQMPADKFGFGFRL